MRRRPAALTPTLLTSTLLTSTLLTSSLVLAAAASTAPAVAAGPEPVAPEPVTRAVVKDPAPDARGGPARLRRLAEVRKVAYTAPTARGGTRTIRVTWRRLRNPATYDGPRQRLTTFVDPYPDDSGRFFAYASNRSRFSLFVFGEDDDDLRRVRPETLDVTEVYGARGTTTITFSTEWLDTDRIRVSTMAESGTVNFAYDGTSARVLDLPTTAP